jgi:hypothetical protein
MCGIRYDPRMMKSEWIAIAEVLGVLRESVAASWPPPKGDDVQAIHHRKLVYLAQLEAYDKVATTLAATLDRLSPNFDRHRFLRIVGDS